MVIIASNTWAEPRGNSGSDSTRGRPASLDGAIPERDGHPHHREGPG